MVMFFEEIVLHHGFPSRANTIRHSIDLGSTSRLYLLEYFNTNTASEIMMTAQQVKVSSSPRMKKDVESPYSQTDKEMLAVVLGTLHYYLYVYGSTFTVRTDHEPLLGIFKSSKPASARIDR